MTQEKGSLSINSENIFPIIKKWLYSDQDIFIRELISNGVDAIAKLRKLASLGEATVEENPEYRVDVVLNPEDKLITITDNGIGMTDEEVKKYINQIAFSGAAEFMEKYKESSEDPIIGHFGLGFYSAFMVSSRVAVDTKAFGSDEAWHWESTGLDGYEITPGAKADRGTTITLYLKEDSEDENYSEFLDQFRLQDLVKKYSDYIRYPIRMEVSHTHVKEGTGVDGKDPEYETHTEVETLNSMTPIWKKAKSEVTDEEMNAFYKEKFYDWQDPLKVIRTSTEGAATYTALLFIPSHAPMDYYTREYEKGLQLYASGVLIMDKCADLLPDCFSFVKGLVDSQDLSLNISREMLQHDRQLKLIASRLEKKIASELQSMLNNDREKYEQFWKAFGLQMKYGLYDNYGAKKDELKDLVLFTSSAEKKLTSLKEYVSRMKPEQKYIYYGCGETVERVLSLPQAETLQEKGFEMLCLTDNVDEFALRMLMKYDDKEFRNISSDDLELESTEEKEKVKELAEENKDMLAFVKESLGDKVKDVRLSGKLKSHAVCITTDGMISTEMEKVLNAMPAQEKIKAQRVLEINGEHPIFQRLQELYQSDKERLKLYAEILYDQALLLEGISLEDPSDFSQKLCQLL